MMLSTPSSQSQPGNIGALIPAHQYRVIKSFIDYYGNAFEQDQLLRFKECRFLPYHGGYTIVFDERCLYLQEEENRDILEHFSLYITLVNV